ncbi:putative metalloprotease [Ascoidea rubescens DSM 1968]|uniref:Mitochondrial inner membrane protease ATP23 n=1 Tax=Ascoidea rubescens DSM 1968 TaxID=1344418 RepID=A0A1D2VI02_9ASCO|nr:putative metalloprotease of the mitochondrial inner membrane [Ascoidea rubescens DSM 1968]ODV61235.1 putative metalloprotease of the mitochondrial inner membrane [Ascoidea rubescens DSM 1968]
MASDDIQNTQSIDKNTNNISESKAFDWWRRTVQYKTGISLSDQDKLQYEKDAQDRKQKRDCEACYEYRDWMLQYSPSVKFMLQQIKDISPNPNTPYINENNIICEHCNEFKGGGFNSELGVLICQNRIYSKWQLEDIMTHELVHAYDNLKFKVDWFNLRHHACSEIRASSLSGECRFANQFFKGAMKNFKKGHQECVKRRAILSLTSNPQCENKQRAEKVIDEVWESCFNDTRPFERIFR